MLGTIREGIETADQVLSLYDRIVDRVIPWKAFNETLVELDKFRKDYSSESAQLIGEVKTLMMNGIDAYFTASQNVYEWTGLTIPLLQVYIKLYNGYNEAKAAGQKKLLLQVLEDGVDRMNAAQEELYKSSASFNGAAGKLTVLHSRFAVEFDEKSEYFQSKITQIRLGAYLGSAVFGIVGVAIAAGVVEGKLVPDLKEKMASIEKFYDHLNEKILQAAKDIDETKKQLQEEIEHIGKLKVATKTTTAFIDLDEIPDMRDIVIKSINDLITNCIEYRTRHIKKNEFA